MPTAIKLSDAFVEIARGEGRVMGRSIAGQVEHWARLGRAVERAPGFAYERIHAVLSGQGNFDELGADEQAVALAELEGQLEQGFSPEREAAFFAKLRAARVPIYGESEPSSRGKLGAARARRARRRA